MVRTEPARAAGPLAGKASHREELAAAPGVQGVCECLCEPAVPDHSHRPEVGLPVVELEPLPTDILPPAGCVAVLRLGFSKSESGCSDPPRHQRQSAERGVNHEIIKI